MRTCVLATTAWLAFTAFASAQPINPGAAVELPVYPVNEKEQPDEFGEPGASKNPTFYFSFENLFWWVKPNSLDRAIVGSLVNPNVDYNSFSGAGGLSDPNTTVLYGNQRIDNQLQWGLRGTVQLAFDDMNNQVVEFVGMYLPRQSVRETFTSTNGSQALALLYNDVSNGFPGTQSAFPIAGVIDATLQPGVISVDTYSSLWGAECNLVHRFSDRHHPFMADMLIGYRHQGLREGMTILAGRFGDAFEDRFLTTNYFNGAQFGGRVGVQWWHFVFQLTGKTAVGLTDQALIIETQNYGNGSDRLYDQVTNFGKTGSARLGFITEGGANVSWAILPNLAFTGGYSGMYWNRVMRPTNQIDSNVNFNQVSGSVISPYNPLRRDQRNEFWAHGASFSLELMY